MPEIVVRRLATYLRTLNEYEYGTSGYISSQQLGDKAGVTSAQVRKDLALFGEFGKQGVGYQIGFLRDEIAHILHADQVLNFAIIGAGELGTAFARYVVKRFEAEANYPFRLAAIIDVDPDKVGTDILSVPVSHLDDLPALVSKHSIKMALITVPAIYAQDAVDLAVEAGLKALLNFAPVKLNVPDDVRVNNADVSLDLHELAYFIQ